MRLQRMALVGALIILFIVCFQSMNNRYDPLARYKYTDQLTTGERDLILAHMNSDDIDFMIQQKLSPNQYMKYIMIEGFNVKNTLYYEACVLLQPVDLNYLVYFVNKYKGNLKYSDLETTMLSYTYTSLEEFYNNAYTYVEEPVLIVDPTRKNTTLNGAQTVYKYVPTSMENIDNSIIPTASLSGRETLQVKKEVIAPLEKMCDELQAINGQTAGGLILTRGFVSYEEQVKLYEQSLIKYGFDAFQTFDDFPGQSEHQLGYSVSFTIASMDATQLANSEQAQWLAQNAKKYGFVVRYPKEEETRTGKVYQPFTLRYIGKEANAKDFDMLNYFALK